MGLTPSRSIKRDEVDLHPKRQRELLSFLDQLFPNFQFVVTTHSPMTAQQAGEGELHCLTREAGEIQLHQFSGNPKTLLLNQFVMTPGFALDTDESKEVEDMKNRYRQLRDKADLASNERAELDQLKASLTDLPTGGRSNLTLSEGHAQLLRKIEKELRKDAG